MVSQVLWKSPHLNVLLKFCCAVLYSNWKWASAPRFGSVWQAFMRQMPFCQRIRDFIIRAKRLWNATNVIVHNQQFSFGGKWMVVCGTSVNNVPKVYVFKKKRQPFSKVPFNGQFFKFHVVKKAKPFHEFSLCQVLSQVKLNTFLSGIGIKVIL